MVAVDLRGMIDELNQTQDRQLIAIIADRLEDDGHDVANLREVLANKNLYPGHDDSSLTFYWCDEGYYKENSPNNYKTYHFSMLPRRIYAILSLKTMHSHSGTWVDSVGHIYVHYPKYATAWLALVPTFEPPTEEQTEEQES